jgi:biopolymer transport protein ExbD
MKRLILLLTNSVLLVSFSRGADVLFTGMISDSAGQRYLLTDSSSGVGSGFIKAGQEFRGYTVVKYLGDPQQALLVRDKNGDKVLPLIKASLGISKETPSSLTFAISADGTVFMNGEGLPLDVLLERLKALAQSSPEGSFVMAPAGNPTPEVLKTMNEIPAILKKAGFKRFTVSIRPEKTK